MEAGGSNSAMESIRDLFQSGSVVGLSDGELLERFVRRDSGSAEVAFTALVDRHGPMVLRVCRTLLGDRHEAEDAFQATFLVLARRAGSIRAPGLLANWLYGVAHRTARKARGQALRRRAREVREDATVALEVIDRGDPHELALVHREQAGLIHQELERLPEKERAVVVLCCLEGMKVEETADRLRCTPGAVRGRLAQARSRLRDRLARRGVAVPAAILTAALSAETASAALTPRLRDLTTQAAMGLTGKTAAAGTASASAVAAARSVSRLMLLADLKLPALALATLVAVAAGLGTLAYKPPGLREANSPRVVQDDHQDPRRFVQALAWNLAAVDPVERTITLQAGKGQFVQQAFSLVAYRDVMMPSGLSLAGLRVAAEATITVDGRPSDFPQLRIGMQVSVDLAADRGVTALRARSVPSSALFVQVVEAVDVNGRTLSFSVADPPVRLNRVRVAEKARVYRFDAPPDGAVRLATLELADVRPGMPASINLEAGSDGRLSVSSLYCADTPGKKEEPR